MKRLFFIIYHEGADQQHADSAAEAERKAFVPGGFKNVIGVVDASLIATSRRPLHVTEGRLVQPKNPRSPFVAVIGLPMSGGLPR